MKLGNGTRGKSAAAKTSDCAPLTTVSLGLASMVAATTGASAQQAAEPAPLPPLEVTAKQAKATRRPQRRRHPSSRPLPRLP